VTELRQRFIDDMQLHGFSERTTMIYTRLINKALPDPIAAINQVMDNIK
jgi:hypothetical protein